MKKAVIKNGVVTNIIIADDDFQLPGTELISLGDDDKIDIGYIWDGEKFNPPEPVIEFEPIDEEKLAMAEAIIQHEMEIQQLKAELAALKRGEE